MEQIRSISSNLVDVARGTIFPAVIEIENGIITAIQRKEEKERHFLIPGFVDAHVHIESSMLPPSF